MAQFEELMRAVKAGDAAAAQRLALGDPALLDRRGAEGATAILLALYMRHQIVADALVPLKPRLDLYEAAAVGDVARVAALIEGEPAAIDRAAPDGFSALGLACFFGRDDVAELLLARGADANQPSANAMRVRPLHSAAAGRHVGIARALLAHGADPNAAQHKGYTALQSAAQHGHLELMALLLAHGADPMQANEDGATAVSLAETSGHAEAVTVLTAHRRKAECRPIGLICAIPEEIGHFGAHFVETAATTLAGFTFRTGLLDARETVVVEAGIGKVNAAIVTTLLLERFGCRALVFSGVAGGLDPDLGIGDVVIATRLIQHDYGAVFQGKVKVYQPGVPPMPQFAQDHGYGIDPGLERRVRAAVEGVSLPPMPAAATGGVERRPRITFGTVLTGDQYVNDEDLRRRLHGNFQAKAVEMEGAAIAQVAERYGVPCLIVRSLSDLAGHDSHMDFYVFVEAAAAGAAELVRRLVAVV